MVNYEVLPFCPSPELRTASSISSFPRSNLPHSLDIHNSLFNIRHSKNALYCFINYFFVLHPVHPLFSLLPCWSVEAGMELMPAPRPVLTSTGKRDCVNKPFTAFIQGKNFERFTVKVSIIFGTAVMPPEQPGVYPTMASQRDRTKVLRQYGKTKTAAGIAVTCELNGTIRTCSRSQ